MIEHLSNRELILHVDNKPSATELERELAERLDALICEYDKLRKQLHNYEDDYK